MDYSGNGSIWTRDSEEFLIESIKIRRSIWDHRDPVYSKKSAKREAYKELAQELTMNFPELSQVTSDQVRSKFNNLKTYFIREYRKGQNASGGSVKHLIKWELFDNMSFLIDAYDNLPTQSSEKNEVSMLAGDVEENSAENLQPNVFEAEEISSTDPLQPESPSPSPIEPEIILTQLSRSHHERVESGITPHRKTRESLNYPQERRRFRPQTIFQYDSATEAVNECLKSIPEAEQHLKTELMQRVFSVVADIRNKCNRETSGLNMPSQSSTSPTSIASDPYHTTIKTEYPRKRKFEECDARQSENTSVHRVDSQNMFHNDTSKSRPQAATSRHHSVSKAVDSLLEFIPDTYTDLKNKFVIQVFTLMGNLASEYGAEVEKRRNDTTIQD